MTDAILSIGAIGWWNYDNQGDLAMLSALRQGLAPHRVVPIDIGFPANRDTINRLNRLDYIVLGGGTLIPGKPASPFDTFDHWADQLRCPLGVVGLGVDPVQGQYWPAVEALLNQAQFFHVRDQTSRALLHHRTDVQVTPDLTFANPLSVSERSMNTPESPLVCGVNLRRAADFDPLPWLEAMRRLPLQIKRISLSSFGIFDENALLRSLDPTRPERFDAGLYTQIDLMIGVAFHSVLFAVQAAVPVIAISYAPKVRNFMEDNGLAHYLLAPDEHQRLSELLEELMAERSEIAIRLCTIRTRLHQTARQSLDEIRSQIEQSGPRHARTGPRVVIAIVNSGNPENDQRTQASCVSQNYENVEVMLVNPASLESIGRGLHETLTQSDGEYVTWVEGGDWFADDALDCLVSRMEEEPQWDVAYTDYYVMSGSNVPVGHHSVPGPEKLKRRDVVGPCFLMRRAILSQLNQAVTDASLPAYSLWLHISSSRVLIPLHAPLFYSVRTIKARAWVEREREVRSHWRQSQPVWSRVVWKVMDSEVVERIIVQPLVQFRRILRKRSHAGHR